MSQLNWLKQSKDKPLFQDILWSQPEHKSRAGRLLIIGGSPHGFNLPASAYNLANKAGAGSVKVLLPDSLRSSLGDKLEDTVFAPSTKIGSFSRQATSELIDYASWADLTLLAGDLGHNSETAILIETFTTKYIGPLTVSHDAIDFFMTDPKLVTERDDTLIVADLSKLQKLVTRLKLPVSIYSSMSLLQLVELLSDLTSSKSLSIITSLEDQIVVSSSGLVSTTKVENLNNWALAAASYSSVWWLQNKTRTFDAITTGIYASINGDTG